MGFVLLGFYSSDCVKSREVHEVDAVTHIGLRAQAVTP